MVKNKKVLSSNLVKLINSSIYPQIIDTSDQLMFDSDDINKSIKALAGTKNTDTLIAFDIEFYNCKIPYNKNFISYNSIDNKYIYSFIREFGMLVFTYNYDNQTWGYYGKLFFNTDITMFDSIINIKDLAIIQPTYMTIDSINIKNKIESVFEKYKILHNSIFNANNNKNISYNYTYIEDYNNDKLESYHSYINNLYYKTVKNRVLDNKSLYNLLTVLHNNKNWVASNKIYPVSVLVKGKRDFEALYNSYKLFTNNVTDFNFDRVYDIEIYNNLSHVLFNSAELSNTCIGLLNTKYVKNINIKSFKKFIKLFSKQCAHNPVYDSACTFMIAVILNLIDIKTLKAGSYYKYLKYKSKLNA